MDERTSPWPGRRVLVTGCTGLLGGAVVRELLGRGAEVVGLVRDRAGDAEFTRHKLAGKAHVLHGRVEDTFRIHSALAVYEVGAVFHLAAGDPNQPDRGTATVLEAVRRYDPRIPVVLAKPAGEPEVPGQPPPVPLGVARFGELFGGGDRKVFRVVPATVVGLITGDRGAPAADGPARDFVFVRDAARACLVLADAVARRPGVHLAEAAFRSGWALTDREMAAAVRDAFAGRVPHLPRTDAPANPLGWEPVESFPDAVGATIAWYREFLRTRFFGTRPSDPPHRAAA
jgi:CDP-glucose 4,6-dehydratase